jgi:hypothetical protein
MNKLQHFIVIITLFFCFLTPANTASAKIEYFNKGNYGYKTGDKVVVTIEYINSFGFFEKHKLYGIIVGNNILFLEDEQKDFFMSDISIKEAIELHKLEKVKNTKKK